MGSDVAPPNTFKNPSNCLQEETSRLSKNGFKEVGSYLEKKQVQYDMAFLIVVKLFLLLKIQRELDESKFILHKTIDSILERGEKLDSLVEKSSDLSAASQV
ncbi:hypothetical protein M8C21_000129, partial [Ambrosia artemisiifolia]